MKDRVIREHDDASKISLIIAEARRIEEDALYSSKGHFEASAAWGLWHISMGVLMTATATIGGVAAVNTQSELAAVCSFVSAVIGALITFLDPREKTKAHLDAGNSYKALNNDARIFANIECNIDQYDERLKGALTLLSDRRNHLNSQSPAIPRRSYLKAKHGIDAGGASYSVDDK